MCLDKAKHKKYRGMVCHICTSVVPQRKVKSINVIGDHLKSIYLKTMKCPINTNDWAPTIICQSCINRLTRNKNKKLTQFAKWQCYDLIGATCPFEAHFGAFNYTFQKKCIPLPPHPAISFVDAPEYEVVPPKKRVSKVAEVDPLPEPEEKESSDEEEPPGNDEDWKPTFDIKGEKKKPEFKPFTLEQVTALGKKLDLSLNKHVFLFQYLRRSNALDPSVRTSVGHVRRARQTIPMGRTITLNPRMEPKEEPITEKKKKKKVKKESKTDQLSIQPIPTVHSNVEPNASVVLAEAPLILVEAPLQNQCKAGPSMLPESSIVYHHSEQQPFVVNSIELVSSAEAIPVTAVQLLDSNSTMPNQISFTYHGDIQNIVPHYPSNVFYESQPQQPQQS